MYEGCRGVAPIRIAEETKNEKCTLENGFARTLVCASYERDDHSFGHSYGRGTAAISKTSGYSTRGNAEIGVSYGALVWPDHDCAQDEIDTQDAEYKVGAHEA